MKVTMVQTTTTRKVRVGIDWEWFDVEIDIDVPYDEICMNMYEQYSLEQEVVK